MRNDVKLLEELVYNKYKSNEETVRIIDDECDRVIDYIVKKSYMEKDYKSDIFRQIDVTIFVQAYEGQKFIAVECKDYKEKIDIQELESL